MKKAQLERALQSLELVPSPKATIEQYATPPGIAAEVVYFALGRGDVADRSVLDAGCGNGILGIAAALLGARRVLGVDIDPEAIDVARRNARRRGVAIAWAARDIGKVEERVDTVLMNPPFGAQRKHADLPFLDRALDLGAVVYSFHNAKTRRFVERRIAARGARITDRIDYAFPIARTFPFHRDDARAVPVTLFRTEAAKG